MLNQILNPTWTKPEPLAVGAGGNRLDLVEVDSILPQLLQSHLLLLLGGVERGFGLVRRLLQLVAAGTRKKWLLVHCYGDLKPKLVRLLGGPGSSWL